MKKVGLFLLAVVMVAGMAGCGSEDNKLTAADMAGTYSGVGVDEGVTTSYTIVLTSSGTFTEDRVEPIGPLHASGTYTVDDPTLLFTYSAPEIMNGQLGSAEILDGGKAILVARVAVLTKQ